MSEAGKDASMRGLALAIKLSFILLLLSAFRAPADLQSLEPVVRWFKVFTRFGILGLLFVGLGFAWQHVSHSRTIGFYIPFLAFCGWGILSIVWSPLRFESFGQIGSLSTLVLFSIAVSVYVRDATDFSRFLTWMLTCLIGLCLVLLVTGILIPVTGHMTRAGLGLGHSTSSGATASITLVLLVLSILFGAWRRSLGAIAVGVLICLAVMLISANRLSIAIAAILIAGCIVLYGGRYIVAAFAILIATAGTLYPIALTDTSAVEKVYRQFNRDQSTDEIASLSGRLDMWEAMWQSFRESPWIGHGYFVSSSAGEFVMWYSEGELPAVNWTAHNIWIQCLVTTGIIGFALFLTALGIPLGSFLLRAHRYPKLRSIHAMILIVMLWYGAWGILNESILGPVQPECVVFFAILGMAIGVFSQAASIPTGVRPRYAPSPLRGSLGAAGEIS